MALTREEVRHVATLCRIGLTDEEVDELAQQLSHILELFQVLREVDTEGVPPTGHSVALETVMCPDEPGPSLKVEDVLANAPRREGDLFRVEVVLDE